MSYLERWDVWLFVILLILIFIYFWYKSEPGETCTTTARSRASTVPSSEEPKSNYVTTLDYTVHSEEERLSRVLTSSQPSRVFAIDYPYPVPLQQTLPVPTIKDQSAGEKKCTEVIRSIYPYEEIILQTRPTLLRNPETGRNLELDIYIPRLKLAWEYDGKQHAQVVKKFHPNGQADLDAQKKRDELKNRLCYEAGIHLTRVPHTVRINQIEDYIRHHLPK